MKISNLMFLPLNLHLASNSVPLEGIVGGCYLRQLLLVLLDQLLRRFVSLLAQPGG